MKESVYLSLIRLWAALAWADNNLAPQQEAGLKLLPRQASMLDEAERRTAQELCAADEPVSFDFAVLDTAALAGLSRDLREDIYRAAVHMARLGRGHRAELDFLRRLGKGLRLPERTTGEIESLAN